MNYFQNLKKNTLQKIHQLFFPAWFKPKTINNMDINSNNISFLLALKKYASEQTIEANQWLTHENEKSNDFYLVLSGTLEGLKRASTGNMVLLTSFKENDIIGELSALDNAPRSLSIRALSQTKVLVFSLAKLKKALSAAQYANFTENLAKMLSRRLRLTSQQTIEALESQLQLALIRIKMGIFLCYSLIILGLFILTLGLFQNLIKTSSLFSKLTSIPALLTFIVALVIFFFHNKQPMSFYGVNLYHWKKAIFESIIFTIPWLFLVLLVKWVIISFPAYHKLTLFYLSSVIHTTPKEIHFFIFTLVIYSLFIILQELIARGVTQTCLQNYLVETHSKWLPIFIANLLFSVMHIHNNIGISLLVFLPGMFWGWLYARQKTLLGVVISHILLGNWALGIVGIEFLQ